MKLGGLLRQVQGWVKLKGNTDGTLIGNVLDSIKTTITNTTANPIPIDVPDQDYDAFHRLRVSNPTTLMEFSHRYPKNHSRYWDTATVGAGTGAHDANKVSQVMTNGLNDGDYIVHRTKRYVQYLKGKSQLIYTTFNFLGGVAGVNKEVGYYDDDNGVFLRLKGTDPCFVVRSKVSGSVVDTEYCQSAWNVDKFDGTGASGETIDWNDQQLLQIDLSWLGSNIVRFSFVINGEIYTAHKQNHSNSIAVPYMQSANLPVSFRVENTTAQGTAPTARLTCGSVISEGGNVAEGVIHLVDTGVTAVNVNTTPKLVAGLRMNPLYNQASIKPLNFDIIATSGNSEIYFRVILEPTIVGGVWADVVEGIGQGLTSYTSYSGGFVISSGYVKAGDRTTFNTVFTDAYIGRLIDGTSQALVLELTTVNSTASILFDGVYREHL